MFCVCFCVVSKSLKTPNLSPIADDAATQDGIRGLGSLVYICGTHIVYRSKSHAILTEVLVNFTLGTRVYSKDVDSPTKPLVDFICPILQKKKVLHGK